MKRKICQIIVILSLFLGGVGLLSQNLVLAVDCTSCSGNSSNLSTQGAIQCGSSCASGNNQSPDQAQSKINSTVRTIVNILSSVGGIAAVLMIIIGGFRYITSGGKQESIASAKNTILYAVIGLVIIAVAQVIVRFVLTSATTDCVNHKTSSGQAC